MAKTRLFGQLRRIAARALAEHRADTNGPTAGSRRGLLTRRQVGLGAAQLGAAGVLSACGGDDSESTAASNKVAIVGAGIAGLHCAYRLQQSGVNVTVYEASKRVGGRMFTVQDDAYAGQIIELGGELIDSNHETLMTLADELDITLDDRLADASIQPDVWFVAGAEVPEATIVEQFTAVAPAMAAAAAAADDENDATAFDELNEQTLSDWLDQNVPVADHAELNAILVSAYRGEFGLEVDEQSALNMLYLIGSDEPDPFRIFGESDERYHAREGSGAFPTRLAQRLSEGTVQLETKLTGLSGDAEHGYTLSLTDAGGNDIKAQADYVVLAIPYSVLRKVQLDVPLSELKQRIIAELGYGTNAKVMGSFESRVWSEQHQKSGSITSDLPLQQAWDTSMGQPGERGILTIFLGGKAGVDVGQGSAEDYYTGLLADLERVFPGTAEAYRAGSARRMHWPSYEFNLGSYTCYRPGQWEFYQHEGEREGNVHFCGEHTSADFQGWMEGGAETGALVAAEIIDELGLQPSPALAKLTQSKTVVPQPTFQRAGIGKLTFGARQRVLAQQRATRAAAHMPAKF